MRPEENIENLIKSLHFKASPEMHERTLNDVLDAHGESKKTEPAEVHPKMSRVIMKSRIAKAVAAVVIIVAIVVGAYNLGGSIDGAGVAWADVAATLATIPSAVYQWQEDGEQYVVYLSEQCGTRFDKYARREVVEEMFFSPARQERITIYHESKEYKHERLTQEETCQLQLAYDPRRWLDGLRGETVCGAELGEREFRTLGSGQVQGEEAEGIEIRQPYLPYEVITVTRIWVSTATGLPIRGEIEEIELGETTLKRVVTNFRWNVELAPALFEPNILQGYALRKEELPSPPSKSKFRPRDGQ
ncbi:MAG: hypothetical protein ACYSTG_00305 [Planctomycetota bacterium]|jgi:hypothetical protein